MKATVDRLTIHLSATARAFTDPTHLMSKTIRCPCGAQLRLGQNAQGTLVRCPKCQRQLRLKDQGVSPSRSASVGNRSVPSASATKDTMIELHCGCGARLRAGSSAIGKKVRCPKCHQPVPVQAGSPPAAAPVAEAVLSVTATPVDDDFDLDFPAAATAPPPAASMGGFGMSSYGAGRAQAAPYWTQHSWGGTVSLKAGSPPMHVIRGGAIALLVIISLTVICQVGVGVTMKVAKAHARELGSQRSASADEARRMRDEAFAIRDRYVTALKIFTYGYCLLRMPALVAVLACGVGLVMAGFQVRGGILVVLIATCAIGVVLIGMDAAMRSIPMLTSGLLSRESRLLSQEPHSIPADMWLATLKGFRSTSGTVWMAGAIEALWGAFFAGVGIYSAMWRYNQNRGGLTLPVLLSIFGSLYSLSMLVLAGSLASLQVFDERDIQFMMYVMLTILFWTLALFAVLVTHRDATSRST